MIPESDVRVRVTNYYSWKNYHAGWELTVQTKTKKVRVKTCSTDTFGQIVAKVLKALKE